MKVAVFSTKPYDRHYLEQANTEHDHELTFFEPRLMRNTLPLARDFEAICPFVNDVLDADNLRQLSDMGIRLIALRAAGFNNIDLAAAQLLDITIARVPAYSPYAVAEHTVALILTLNRKIHRAYDRVRDGNFSLDGLLGFDLHNRCVGIIGTGKIGIITAEILKGFGTNVVAYDLFPNKQYEESGLLSYVDLPELFSKSDIISLHCPLTPDTYHILNTRAVNQMKPGVMIINTSRGALIDAQAMIDGLKSEQIGYLGLDVYEEEADLFFEDFSERVIQDDVFARLLTFPNVIITGHQGFFTREALQNIADTTLANITEFEQTGGVTHEVRFRSHTK
ncbi:MAG: 2-hydroxyacid dehydrogenase [Anaerolineales bacterium]